MLLQKDLNLELGCGGGRRLGGGLRTLGSGPGWEGKGCSCPTTCPSEDTPNYSSVQRHQYTLDCAPGPRPIENSLILPQAKDVGPGKKDPENPKLLRRGSAYFLQIELKT